MIELIEDSIKSGLKFISSSIFNESSIEKVTIPSSIVDFCQWWYNASKLINVKIIECDQKNAIFYDENFLISKTNIHSNNYDFLHFVRRDIESVTIPSFIKKIDQLAFGDCRKLKYVNFTDDSKIECICKYGFARSNLESILFPNHLKIIENNAFSSCYILKYIEFPENSQLESIGVYSFGFTNIENILLPSHLQKICANSFSDCKKLQKVSFAKNSEIKIIEKSSFYNSSIQKLSIPSSVEVLEDGWSYKTNFLTEIEIIEHKKKNILLFEEKFILGKSDLKSDIYDVLLFARRDIKSASIPYFIKRIANYAFENCSEIKDIYFSEDSELETFEFAFMQSSLERIKIPSCCQKIGKYSFYQCKKLTKIFFPENSQLNSIGEYAFSDSAIHSIIIPSHVFKIDKFIFANCKMLKIVEFENNFELKVIGEKIFDSSSVIIMIHTNNNHLKY